MKKVFGIFMALFFMSSLSFANTTTLEEDDSVRCFEIADSASTAIGGMLGLSHLDEYNVFVAIYDACEAQ